MYLLSLSKLSPVYLSTSFGVDHLAQILELLERRRVPKCLSNGKLSSSYVNRKGELKAIRNLKLWGLRDVLMDKYKFSEEDAKMISSFLQPMLELNPLRRATAREALGHSWLKTP
jgi:serine/threonine-protein kinase SRPK3